MAQKIFTDESLATFVDETKAYIDNAVSTKVDKEHTHSWNDLEDRPFYVGDATFVDVYNGTCTFELNEYINLYMCSLENIESDMTAGDQVKIIWDGTEYECIATNNNYG